MSSDGYGYGVPPPPPPPDAAASLAAAAQPQRSVWETIKTTYGFAPVTVMIIALTVTVWLGHEALQHFAHIDTDLTLGDPESAIHGDWWRLVTPMVVHFGILHIGLNMLALWRIGPPVERVVGSKLYLMAYVLSGVGGQVVSDLATKSVVLADGSRVWPLSGGASGAIFGVIGLLVAYYAATAVAERAGRRPTSNWRFNPKAVISLAVQATIWLLIAGPLFHFDSAAHAGGAAVGLVIGAFVGWSRTAPPPPPSPSTRLTHLE